MIVYNQKSGSCKKAVQGGGIINSIINKLPFEIHVPGGYQYCGPGTKLKERLARGDPGINELDKACKQHDISYSESNNIDDRHRADKILQEKAWQRVYNNKSSIGERAASYLIVNAMKAKRKFGMGLNNNTKRKASKKGKNTYKIFKKAINEARKTIKNNKPLNNESAAEIAIKTAKNMFASNKLKKSTLKHRIIPIPKTGGILPLIPIFAGLSALGSLAGGAAGIVKTINNVNTVRKQFQENVRHNKAMENKAAVGNGLFLKPYKQGFGLYLQPYSKN